jgi:hypothetical protein
MCKQIVNPNINIIYTIKKMPTSLVAEVIVLTGTITLGKMVK